MILREILKYANMPNSNLEGFAFQLIGFKLTTEQMQILNDLFDHYEVKGEFLSGKMRNLIIELASDLLSEKKSFTIQSDGAKSLSGGEALIKVTTNEESNLNIPPCHYRAITNKKEWFCDVQKIAKEVCVRRQRRFLVMQKQCYPSWKEKRGRQTKPRTQQENYRYERRKEPSSVVRHVHLSPSEKTDLALGLAEKRLRDRHLKERLNES